MAPDDFAAGLEAELRLRGLPFSRDDVLAFVGDVWDLSREDPDPVRWAECFIEAGYTGGDA
jgi:hypothetical protein